MAVLSMAKQSALLHLLLVSLVVFPAQCFVICNHSFLTKPAASVCRRRHDSRSSSLGNQLKRHLNAAMVLRPRAPRHCVLSTGAWAKMSASGERGDRRGLRSGFVVAPRILVRRRMVERSLSQVDTATAHEEQSSPQAVEEFEDLQDMDAEGEDDEEEYDDGEEDQEHKEEGEEDEARGETNEDLKQEAKYEEREEGDREAGVGHEDAEAIAGNRIEYPAAELVEGDDDDDEESDGEVDGEEEEEEEELRYASYYEWDNEDDDGGDRLYWLNKLESHLARIDDISKPPPIRGEWETTSFSEGEEYDYSNFSQWSFHVDLPIKMGDIDEKKKDIIQPALMVLGNIAELIDTTDDVFSFKYYGLIRNRLGIEAWARKMITECYPETKDVKMITNRTRDLRDY